MIARKHATGRCLRIDFRSPRALNFSLCSNSSGISAEERCQSRFPSFLRLASFPHLAAEKKQAQKPKLKECETGDATQLGAGHHPLQNGLGRPKGHDMISGRGGSPGLGEVGCGGSVTRSWVGRGRPRRTRADRSKKHQDDSSRRLQSWGVPLTSRFSEEAVRSVRLPRIIHHAWGNGDDQVWPCSGVIGTYGLAAARPLRCRLSMSWRARALD